MLRKSNIKGFTLIELAIVLIVIGISVTAATSYIKTSVKASKLEETQNLLDKSYGTIINYAKTNGGLPNSIQLKEILSSPTDLFGKDYIYYIDNGTQSGTSSIINSLCDRDTTKLSVQVCYDLDCNQSFKVNNVSFILGSSGINKVGKIEEIIENTDNLTVKVFKTPGNDNVIKWITLPELQGYLNCYTTASSSGSRLQIITPNLPPVNVKEKDDARLRIYADGGNGDYEWCVEYDNKSPNSTTTTGLQLDYYTINYNQVNRSIPLNKGNKCQNSSFTKGEILGINIRNYSLNQPVTALLRVYVKSKNDIAEKSYVLPVYDLD